MMVKCPYCDTAFRVVADQLRVRDGRVRCGVCREVFDGRAVLQDAVSGSSNRGRLPTQEPSVAADSELPLAAPLISTASEVPWLSDNDSRIREGDEPGPVLIRESAPTPVIRATEPLPVVRAEPQLPDSMASLGPTPGLVMSEKQHMSAVLGSQTEPVIGLSGWRGPNAAHPVAPQVDPASAGVTREPIRHTANYTKGQFSASRGDAPLPPLLAAQAKNGVTRLLWSLGFWLAMLVLLAQALWWWRLPLTAHFPSLRIPLEHFCQAAGCEVGYLRAPQSLRITASSVHPDPLAKNEAGVQRLQLQATLRNQAPHAQPWPSLDIVLTDHGDTQVANRIVPPSVYLPPALQRQPFEAGAQYTISLALTVRGQPVNGYKIQHFFP